MILDQMRNRQMGPARFDIRENETSYVEVRRVTDGVQIVKRDKKTSYFTALFTISDYKMTYNEIWIIEESKRKGWKSKVHLTGLSHAISNTSDDRFIYKKGDVITCIQKITQTHWNGESNDT